MTNEMIEYGAAAMREKRRELINQPLDRIWPDLMRAAIEAMREPTDAMATHPMATCYNYGPYGDKEVRRIWRSMIDAALNAESVPLMPVYGSTPVED